MARWLRSTCTFGRGLPTQANHPAGHDDDRAALRRRAGGRGAPDRSSHRRAGAARASARPRASARREGRRWRDAVRLAQRRTPPATARSGSPTCSSRSTTTSGSASTSNSPARSGSTPGEVCALLAAIAGAAAAGTRASVGSPSLPLPCRLNNRRAPGTARDRPERLGQRVELRQGVLRPVEPHLDPPALDRHPIGQVPAAAVPGRLETSVSRSATSLAEAACVTPTPAAMVRHRQRTPSRCQGQRSAKLKLTASNGAIWTGSSSAAVAILVHSPAVHSNASSERAFGEVDEPQVAYTLSCVHRTLGLEVELAGRWREDLADPVR